MIVEHVFAVLLMIPASIIGFSLIQHLNRRVVFIFRKRVGPGYWGYYPEAAENKLPPQETINLPKPLAADVTSLSTTKRRRR